jgi:ligand-binding sensor domain-containing protein
MNRVIALAVCLAAAAVFGGEPWENLTKDGAGLPGDEIQFIKQEAAGAIWIGTLSGLGRVAGDKVSVVIPKGMMWDVLERGGGAYWIGTARGAVLLAGDTQTPTLKGRTVAPLVKVNDTLTWTIAKHAGAGTNTLLANSSGDDAWVPVPAFEKEKVEDLTRTADGNIWVAIDGNGVLVVPAATPDATPVRHLEGSNVTAIFQDARGQVWCGTWGQGVFVYDGEGWTRHLKKEKAAIMGIVQDTKAQIWVSTSASGLWRYNSAGWENYLRDEGGINMLETTSDGRVWISSQMQGGLRYWDGAKWVVSLDSPLPIRCLVEAADKTIWAGGVLDGVHRLKRN